jgi:hypothetical protein
MHMMYEMLTKKDVQFLLSKDLSRRIVKILQTVLFSKGKNETKDEVL